mgnify:CR=1 FL=1
MKRLILLFAVLLTISVTSCKNDASKKVDQEKAQKAQEKAQQEKSFPKMTYEEEVYDFGTITSGETVEHEFTFKNTGEAPLVISNARASCGCTVPSWTKESIKPGESGSMLVKFNSRGKKNQQNKMVRVTANTEKGTETIRIKAFVEPKNK